jgi:putative ATP-dependent endonuclease of the OLD family
MLLKSLSIKNLKCHENLIDVPFHPLTVFIGENDAGKTCIADALELLLHSDNATEQHFRKNGEGCVEEKIVISGVFEIQNNDNLPEDWLCPEKNTFILKRKFIKGEAPLTEIMGKGFEDERINNFEKISASEQKEILQGLGVEPLGKNTEERVNQIHQLIEQGRLVKKRKNIQIKFAQVKQHLPLFQRIASSSYQHPDTIIQSTLRLTITSCLSQINESTGERVPLAQVTYLQSLIQKKLNERIKEVRDYLQKYNKYVNNVEIVPPEVDFSRGIPSPQMELDIEGRGRNKVDAFGDGTRKKAWLGLLEWQKTVSENLGSNVVTVYDEPDVNLDYSSERKLFDIIQASVSDGTSVNQAIVCTHAFTMIDRAPTSSINYIKVSDDGRRTVEYFDDKGDDKERQFLSSLGILMGVPNSALFYERAFLVVEGDTEANALPLLYQNLYGRSFVQDGIFLLPLHGKSCWKSALHMLLQHKKHVTTLFLDSDCKGGNSKQSISQQSLEEIGYPADFITDNCFFIGNKEFEDAFDTATLIDVMNQNWPKKNGTWQTEDVDQFRTSDKKFGSDLLQFVRQNCHEEYRSTTKKPELGSYIGNYCREQHQIPQRVQDTFIKLRQQAGCA